MSRPFIIWCGQRTSSISIFNALAAVSEHPAAESEPFDGSVEARQFDQVAGAAPPKRDRMLAEICGRGWLLKHVFEYLSPEFNRALARIATSAGYRHIRLDRHDVLARLVSLGVAEQLAVWFPCPATDRALGAVATGARRIAPLDVAGLVGRQRAYEAQWRALEPRVAHVRVWSEDCTSDRPAVRHGALARLLRHAEIPAERLADLDAALFRGGQGTARARNRIVNLSELRAALA